MKWLISLVLLFGMIAYSTPAITYDDYIAPAVVHASSTEPVVSHMAVYSTTTIEALVRTVQAQYDLSGSFYTTLKCESAGWQNEQSQVPHAAGPNGLEDSWGVAQIHLPDHPDVTKTEALDPIFAVPWAAKEFATGHANLFTCYNLLQKVNTPG